MSMTLMALVLVGTAQSQVVPFYTMPADNTRVEKRPCPNCHESPLPPPKTDDWSWAAKPQPCPSHHKSPERPFEWNKFGYYTAPADNTRVAIPYRPLPASVESSTPAPEKKAAPAKKAAAKDAAPVKKPAAVSKPKPVPVAKEQAKEAKGSGAAFDGGKADTPRESVAPVVVPDSEGFVQDVLEGKTYPKPALSSIKTDTQLAEPASPKAAAEAREPKKKGWAPQTKAVAVMAGVGVAWGVAVGLMAGGPLAVVGFALLGAAMFGALGWAAARKK